MRSTQFLLLIVIIIVSVIVMFIVIVIVKVMIIVMIVVMSIALFMIVIAKTTAQLWCSLGAVVFLAVELGEFMFGVGAFPSELAGLIAELGVFLCELGEL